MKEWIQLETSTTHNHKQAMMQITGMTCAACANRIEKGLNKVEGVELVNVNFALEKASVTYNPEKVNVKLLVEKIEKLGYGMVKEVVDFHLEGMTCAACANRIEKGLNKLPGVIIATVNFALETAHVEYSPSEVSVAAMQDKVTKLGYTAISKVDNKNTEDHRINEVRSQQRKLLLSTILSLPLLWSMVSHFSFTSWMYVPDLLMNPWMQLLLATPVQFYIGKQFYVGAYKALRNGSANMVVLVALGTSAAYFYSLYLTLEWMFESVHHGHRCIMRRVPF